MHNGIQERYYRCYFMRDDHIVTFENIFSFDDDEAVKKARAHLSKRSYLSIELWRGKQFIATLTNDGAAFPRPMAREKYDADAV